MNAGYITPRDMVLVRAHWSDYVYAARVTGIPIEALPAIHYRESGLLDGWYSAKRQRVVRNIGGPFMLDCGGEGEDFAKRIRSYEVATWMQYGGRGRAARVRDNFKFACLVAAHELKTKMRGRGLADAMWGYNGRAAWSDLAGSSYVWGDPRHRTMWMRYEGQDRIDTRPGVMVIYAEILELRRLGVLPRM